MKKGNSNQYEFKPTLGLLDALSISIGAIIGAGIFIVVGITAKVAGSALVVSMLLAAIIAVFTALSFAELTAWQPRARAHLDKVVAISTFALLFYYTLANICAIRVNTLERSYPRIIPVLGAYTCLALLVFAFLTSPESWITGIICLAIGALYYSVKQKFFKQERKR
jgi:amino acid transporter